MGKLNILVPVLRSYNTTRGRYKGSLNQLAFDRDGITLKNEKKKLSVNQHDIGKELRRVRVKFVHDLYASGRHTRSVKVCKKFAYDEKKTKQILMHRRSTYFKVVPREMKKEKIDQNLFPRKMPREV